MAEDIILDFSKSKKADMAVMILRLAPLSIVFKTPSDCWVTNERPYTTRYFNVIGSDPEGRLGEAPRPELREHGRISGACFDAALGIIPGLKVRLTTAIVAQFFCQKAVCFGSFCTYILCSLACSKS